MNHRSINSQRGAALVTALVLLTILTLLAITSMGTNMLEEKMASNAQEVNRAFQTAETGIAKILADDDAFNTNNQVNDNGTPFDPTDDVYDFTSVDVEVGAYSADVEYTANFRQKTIPKRGSGWDTSMAFYHFDLGAAAVTAGPAGGSGSNISTALHAGAYQVGKK